MKTGIITINRLAGIVKQGFDEIGQDLSIFKTEAKQDFRKIESDLEDIKLRLDNVPYRFEFIDLEKRVGRLEDVAGIGKK